MWVRRSGAHVSHVMIILTIGFLSTIIITDGSYLPHPEKVIEKYARSGGGGFEYEDDENRSAEGPSVAASRHGNGGKNPTAPIKLEVIAILPDASNESLGLSKALSRALNSVTTAQLNDEESSSSSASSFLFPSSQDSLLHLRPQKTVTWRVRNFVIANLTAQQTSKARTAGGGTTAGPLVSVSGRRVNQSRQGNNKSNSNATISSDKGSSSSSSSSSGKSRTKSKETTNDAAGDDNSSTSSSNSEPSNYFSPNDMPNLCEFIARTKAIAMVNLIGDVGSERLLSLVSTSAALPLIGSAQYANPLQTHHTDKGDFYINLSTSVRHFARALGHLLIYCHWHSFAVLFDDSPSILSSQIIWEEELSQMKMPPEGSIMMGGTGGGGINNNNPDVDSGSVSNYTDYDYEHPLGQGMSSVFENGDTDGLDDPILNPDFITLRTKSSNSAFRALSELTKATQGVIVLLCSQRSLIQVFRAAQQLRMLNGDYVFILVGQYSQFEVIPDWIPSGVLALRSPRSAQVGKHTMKTTGKLLASALVSVKNQPVSPAALEEPRRPPPPRPYVSFPSAGPAGESPYLYYQSGNNRRESVVRGQTESSNQIGGGVFSGFEQASLSSSSSSFLFPLSEQIKSFSSRGTRETGPLRGHVQPHQQDVKLLKETPLLLVPTVINSVSNYNSNNNTTTTIITQSGQSLKQADYNVNIYPKNEPLKLESKLREIRSKEKLFDSNNKKPIVLPSSSPHNVRGEPPQLVYTSAVVVVGQQQENGREQQQQQHHQTRSTSSASTSSVFETLPNRQQERKSILDLLENPSNISCWKEPVPRPRKIVSVALTREMRSQMEVLASSASIPGLPFDILNLVRKSKTQREWKKVGNASVETPEVHLETIRWPGGGIFGPGERPSKAYRVVTIVAPPFVMEAEAEDNRTCVKGFPCLKVNTNNKDQLALIFADFERGKPGAYSLACCDGLAMDLLSSIGRELKFEIDLYLVPDGYFGSRSNASHWNGIMGALISGAAHMSFAPISVTSMRSTVVDFSTPYFFSGIGLLGLSRNRDVPLLAFLAPFSPQLWVAIFVALNMTAVVVALYEWFSPFGLNPWGRQRTKNFSMASALWVVWGRLFSHLVAFKAPKSWPNKFLINVWGGFSVIFVASYTANIAALFAGMFFERAVDVHDRSLLSQRVAAIKHSSADFYIKIENAHLWEHIQRFHVPSFQEGIDMLKNGSLDLLIGDKPLLDYYRGTDPSCNLIDVSEHERGDDTYAVAMARGFPLRETISSLIAKYIANGYMDYLQGKWYGQMACFRLRSQMQGARALGVEAVAGMFIMLGVGMAVGMLILVLELIVYKYALPYFRSQPKGTLWRSPNLMFFSQKLYRFINCVELVSPHHAAKELVNTLRHGQITSLFQKSVKRKEHEQRRRRKSKAQFFEMIQEIRRVQKTDPSRLRKTSKVAEEPEGIYSIQARLESNKQKPKVIRILGESVDIEDQCQQAQQQQQVVLLEATPQQQQHRLSFQSDENLHSRKPSKSSIFSHRNSTSEALSGSRASLGARSLASSPSFYESTKGFFKSAGSSMKSEKKSKKSKNPVTMSTTVVKATDKRPLKTILKKGQGGSGYNLHESGCPSSSLTAIGKKLASASSPTPSLHRLTKTKGKYMLKVDGGGKTTNDPHLSLSSLSNSEESEDVSAAERAEILTVSLTALSKNEVIDLWKTSEADLKSQLAQALKNQEELMEKLKEITEGQAAAAAAAAATDKKVTLEDTPSSKIIKEEERQPP